MNNYQAIEQCQAEIRRIESTLKSVRDNCGEKTKREINLALTFSQALCDNLNGIDKALEKSKEGTFTL